MEHRPAGRRLQVPAPHVLEEPAHGRIEASGLSGELVGVEDAVTRRHQDRRGARRSLGFGDSGHGRADDPGHLDGGVEVDEAHGHHGLEQADRLDVHFGEDGPVVVRRRGIPAPARTAGPPRGGCRSSPPPRPGSAGVRSEPASGPRPGDRSRRRRRPGRSRRRYSRDSRRSVRTRASASTARARPTARWRYRRSVRHGPHPSGEHSRTVVPTGAYTGHVAHPGGHQPVGVSAWAPGPCSFRSRPSIEAKRRLHRDLSRPERADLARAMADTGARRRSSAAGGRRVRRQRRRRWARSRGALVVWEPGRGLNGAVEAGVDHLLANGVTQVTVAHADLPRAQRSRRGRAGAGHHPGPRPLRQRHQRHRPPGRHRLPLLLRARARSPATGPKRSGWGSPCGSSTCPTWPRTSTSQGTSCRWPPAASTAR